MSAQTTTTIMGAATAAPKPIVAKALRFSEARRLARELDGAQTLGLVAGDVWQAAQQGKIRPDAWRSLLALAVDLVSLAANVAPDDQAENVAVLAGDLTEAVYGADVASVRPPDRATAA